MKKDIIYLPVLALLLVFTIVSCTKNENSNSNYDNEVSAQSDDQSNFSAQVDAVANDANIILESSGTFAGRQPNNVIPGVCNASFVMDTLSNPRTITITYNGANCVATHTRTGTVTISMAAGTHWKDAGAAITLTYTNLVITRVADNKNITITGSHTITNVSGGLLVNLPVLNSITHTITSSTMSVKFNDNTERVWQVARQRVFSYNNGIVVTVTGMHTEGSISHIAEWGTNRFGRPFTSAITEPLVFRQDCNFRLVSGQIKHTVPVFSAVGTFGLNSAGSPTSCPGAGSYYCKIVWTGLNNNSYTIIFPY